MSVTSRICRGYRRKRVPGHGDRLLLAAGVTGWAIAEHMRTELVEDALNAAAALRGTLAGAIFHADHGSQYTSQDFAKLCTDLRVAQSMGAIGSSADNALAESFNATLKREVLQGRSSWPDAASCRREVFRWLARYNTKRRHSHCANSSPATYERTHTPATLPKPHNHKSRVHYMGSRPVLGVVDVLDRRHGAGMC